MDWLLLGIEPTKDKKTITDAYRQKLRNTNPEDDPAGFQALRAAYEAALTFAEQSDAPPVRDESPVGLWIESIARLYEDYASRIDPACWKECLHSDVCIGLDTRAAAEEALLKFFLEKYYLPKAVWQVLDETFQFSMRAEELYETWPRDFIDHVIIAGPRLDPALDYSLFTPGISGKDCDIYRNLYHQANRMPIQDIGPILEQMEALSEQHPYGEAIRYRFLLETGHEQQGKAGFCRLASAYPDDAALAIAWAQICLDDGNTEDAQQIASHILEITPEHIGAKTVLAKCLAEKKQYHEAKEYAYEIFRACNEDPILMEQTKQLMKDWNEQLIIQREDVYAANPADADNAIELAWCYAQNNREKEALALALTIDPDCEDAFAYHNLLAKLYHNDGKFAEALPYLQAVEAVVRNMTDDGTAKTQKRIARLPEILQLQGNCLLQLGRVEEAKEKLTQALDMAPEDTDILLLTGKILFSFREYSHAVEIFRKLLWLSPGTWVAELLTALCLYHMRQDREAFEAVNRALSIQENDLSLYILKMQILLRNGRYQDVHDILDFLQENGAPETIATDFIRAELTELEKQDAADALHQYRALRQRVEAGETLQFSEELYYHLAVLIGNQLDLTEERSRNTVLKLIDKGLAFNEQDADLLSYKAWILTQNRLGKEVLAMYNAILEKDPHSLLALRGLADLYYHNLNRHAQKALTYYEKLLEKQKTPELYFYAATCKRYLGDLDGARLFYLKVLEMDPEDMDGLRGLALICEVQGDNIRSLELLDQALTSAAEYGRPCNYVVEQKAKILRRLGRHADALAFVADAAARYSYEDALQLQFDICCQFGLWNDANQVLEQWKQAAPNDSRWMVAGGKLHLLQGKMFKAVLAMASAKRKLSFEENQDFRLQLADLENNYKRQIEIWSQRVGKNPKNDYAMTNLAYAYWHAGNMTAARDAAQKALALQDKFLSNPSVEEALYRTRRCLPLAILGRYEEAKAELAAARKLPLCEFCAYGSCKDADIYEAAIEELSGNTDLAQKLFAAGRRKWPDDLDFAAGEARLRKKRRKKC